MSEPWSEADLEKSLTKIQKLQKENKELEAELEKMQQKIAETEKEDKSGPIDEKTKQPVKKVVLVRVLK